MRGTSNAIRFHVELSERVVRGQLVCCDTCEDAGSRSAGAGVEAERKVFARAEGEDRCESDEHFG